MPIYLFIRINSVHLQTDMINVQSLIQLKAFARIDGLRLALLWIVSFACIMYLPGTVWGSLLMFATPFVMAWLLIKFRNNALYGVISYRRAFAYCMCMVFYGSILFALAQVLYFMFIDHGRFMQIMLNSFALLQTVYKQQGIDTKSIEEAITALSGASPIEITLMFMLQNICIGLIVSAVIGAIGKK